MGAKTISSSPKARESANILVFTLTILKPIAHNIKDRIHMWKDETQQEKSRKFGKSCGSKEMTCNHIDVFVLVSLHKQIDSVLERLGIKQQRRYILKQNPWQ